MNPLKNLTLALLKLNAYEFTAVSALLGYIISDGLNGPQTSAMGNFFENVGQILETIGAQLENLDENAVNDYESSYQELKKKIGNIDEIIADLNNFNFTPR